MANYTATTDMTLEQAIANGPMTNGDNLTINSGATVTCDRTPSILMGQIDINEGKLLIDGVNIGSGNMINFVGEYQEEINVKGQGTLEVNGAWYNIGTTDGTDAQTFNLATYYDSSFCVDVVPMIQIETGRRIDYDTASGTTPEVDDWIYKTSDRSVMGRIVEVNTGSSYIVVRFLTGSLADNDDIEVRKVVDSNGPDLQTSWAAKVNNVSGDIKEAGIYQEFGNSRANGTSFIADFHHGVGGFVFDNAFQSTTLTLATSSGSTGGFRPPSGCTVRIPNVHFSTSNTTNYASNNTYHDGTASENYWYNLGTSSGGVVDFSICNMGSVYFGCQLSYSYAAEYVGASIGMGTWSCSGTPTYSHCVVVPDAMNRGSDMAYAFRCMDLYNGATITDCMKISSEADRMYIGAEKSLDITIIGCIDTFHGNSWNSYSNYCYYFNYCDNVTFDNNVAIGFDGSALSGILTLNTTTNFEANDFKLSCTQDGVAQTNEKNAIIAQNLSQDLTF